MGESTEKNYSKIEWFFYIIILPFLFISILTVSLLWFLDYDVKSELLSFFNKIPYIEKLIDDEQLDKDSYLANSSKEDLVFTVEEMKKTINEKNEEMIKTEGEILSKDEEINNLKLQIDDLQKQLEEKNMSEQTREQEIADLAKIYSNMSAKNAANILSSLSNEEAVLILGQMNTDDKSAILEKMSPEIAADLSILLKDQKYSKDQDIKALQERINELTNEIDNLKSNEVESIDYAQLALTYSNMEPAKAAEVILSLSNKDYDKAVNIIKSMDSISRSNILNEMNSEDAARISADLVE